MSKRGTACLLQSTPHQAVHVSCFWLHECWQAAAMQVTGLTSVCECRQSTANKRLAIMYLPILANSSTELFHQQRSREARMRSCTSLMLT